jgi:hypothetical protein
MTIYDISGLQASRLQYPVEDHMYMKDCDLHSPPIHLVAFSAVARPKELV